MKIALIGYGKMGKAIESIALQKKHTIQLIVHKNNLHDFNEKNLSNIDVIIEFTEPESAYHNIKKALELNMPVVSGTTGWLNQYNDIEILCKKLSGTFIYSSNFSIGVNVLFELNKKLAAIMKPYSNYQINITEIHHTEKKDKPSGTAITLAQSILQENTNYTNWELEKKSNPSTLPIQAIRKEHIPGTHIIDYNSTEDTIEIKHTAHNRTGFALGVILAAEFAIKNKGIFTMKNVLNL